MRDGQLQRLAASGMGLLAVAGFDLFAGGTLLFDIALPVGRQLALLGPDRVAWLDDSSRDPE